ARPQAGLQHMVGQLAEDGGLQAWPQPTEHQIKNRGPAGAREPPPTIDYIQGQAGFGSGIKLLKGIDVVPVTGDSAAFQQAGRRQYFGSAFDTAKNRLVSVCLAEPLAAQLVIGKCFYRKAGQDEDDIEPIGRGSGGLD